MKSNELLLTTLSILKRIRRSMQTKAVKATRANRKYQSVRYLYQALTWEIACTIIDKEMEAIENRWKKEKIKR